MKYYSKLEAIRVPEYGRHIQKMVEFVMALPDRERRNRLAHSIIKTMRGLAPELEDTPSGEQVYWDHLALISGFKLDIDYPTGTLTEARLNEPVTKPPYTEHRIRFRYYGHHITGMIKKVAQMPMCRERAELEYFIALQMKRSYMTWNSEVVDDIKIFKDLYDLSDGEIMLTPENCRLIINPNSIDKGGKQRVKLPGKVQAKYSSKKSNNNNKGQKRK